ncbi:MAG: hypothetical protein B6229_08930 [Spirochaetaceae bacterium 4572_7]|nr:MAG: hypothetical protein B6229_08930 [Spirochaetaceae bacterium 4572_7]
MSSVTGINISSFEEIYNKTPKNSPYPFGLVNFQDGKTRFIISWIIDRSDIKVENVENYTLKLRHYPTSTYPVLSFMVGLNIKDDLWFYEETHMDVAKKWSKARLSQLFNSQEVLFCLFDKTSDNLDTYGFDIDKNELKEMENEYLSIKPIKALNSNNFPLASKRVKNCFLPQGLPKDRDALNVYLKRKELDPKPAKYNWGDFISI